MVYTFEVTAGIYETCLSCRHWWKEDFCLVTRQLAQPGDAACWRFVPREESDYGND